MNNEQLPPILNLDDLSAIVGEDQEGDLDLHELIAKQQRGPLPKSTKIILSIMLLVVMFFAGSFAQQHLGASTSAVGSGFSGGSFAGLRGQGGGSGFGGGTATAGSSGAAGGFMPAGVTTGTITLVDGNHVYVTDATGQVIKVNVSGTTNITVSSKATAAQLKTGQQVLVRGDTAVDGTVTATSVTQGSLPTGAGLPRNGN